MQPTSPPEAVATWPSRFGRAVAARRHELGLSQERLAFQSGLHRTYIGAVERGIRNPTISSAARIAQALGIPFSELVLRAETSEESDAAPNHSKPHR